LLASYSPQIEQQNDTGDCYDQFTTTARPVVHRLIVNSMTERRTSRERRSAHFSRPCLQCLCREESARPSTTDRSKVR